MNEVNEGKAMLHVADKSYKIGCRDTRQAIRAEIERRIAEYNKSIERFSTKHKSRNAERDSWKWAECKSLLSFIDSLPDKNNPDPYNPTYDEDYLNEKIAKATKSWKGVDVDEFMDEMRDGPSFPTSTEMIAEWENNELPMLREKDFRGDAERMAYNAFMDGFAKGLGYIK